MREGTNSWKMQCAVLLTVGIVAAGAFAEKPTGPELVARGVQYLVEVDPDTDVDSLAKSVGMQVICQSVSRANYWYLEAVGPIEGDYVQGLQCQPGVIRAAAGAGVARNRASFVPNDPFYFSGGGGTGNPGQWYLTNVHTPGLDVNSVGAWNLDATGAGAVIGVVDDCLEQAHPDLAPNFQPLLSWDFGQNDADPSPVHDSDRHGTSVAGIAAGRGGNGIGVTGAAPEAGLAGLRVDFPNQTDQMFLDAVLYRTDAIKVKNHSYGIPAAYINSPADVLVNRVAADDGVINVRSAGNDRTGGTGNANAKAVQADRMSLTVTALGSDGRYAYYANYGACVFACAPSSSDAGLLRMTTTDRTGALGYADGSDGGFPHADYTVGFGGTSGAAPVVSGVVAQMLGVNPGLDIRGVKHILADTCVMIDPADPEWQINAAGYHFNPNYGFGLVDAAAAVSTAMAFGPLPAETSVTTGLVHVNAPLPDADPTGVTRTFVMDESLTCETIEMYLSFTHTFAGDLDVVLTSPSGTTSKLAYGYTSSGADDLEWTFSSAAFWGEDVAGTWTLTCADVWASDTGTWDDFHFTAYGPVPEPATLALLACGCVALLRRRA